MRGGIAKDISRELMLTIGLVQQPVQIVASHDLTLFVILHFQYHRPTALQVNLVIPGAQGLPSASVNFTRMPLRVVMKAQ